MEDAEDEDNKKTRKPPQQRGFASLAASHEDGGAVSDFGDHYTSDEINAAEQLRGGDPELMDVPITTIAHLQRKLGIVPQPMSAPEPPLQIRKNRIRKEIVKRTRHLAITRNHENPDFKRVWKEIKAAFGVSNADDLVDNHSLEVMRQVEAWLIATLARESHDK